MPATAFMAHTAQSDAVPAVVIRPVFHSARLDIRPGLQALGTRQIVEKRIDQAILLKGKDLQVVKRYSIKIWEGKQLRHARY